AALAACGDDDDNPAERKSAAGESCLRTNDCSGSLVCVAQVCAAALPSEPRRPGRKGESCQVSSDCDGNLACVNAVCVTDKFAINATANECKVIQCRAAQDCCAPPPAACTSLQDQCAAEEAASGCAALKTACAGGDTTACNNFDVLCFNCSQFDDLCVCDPSTLRCDDGACRTVEACDAQNPCLTGVCDALASECVECLKDDDCGDPARFACSDRACEARCTDDTDCPDFSRCSAGACLASGCRADRECKASTRNALATCVEGECVEPCQTDTECGTSDAWNFRACVEGSCAYVGCESDKECQLFLGNNQPPPSGSGSRDIVCVPRTAGVPMMTLP
ncbi:MAG TPA: hypothetical protein VFS00_29190, partial [Polyangiaceae bacterium]|nr:hypothetical protein [Polyangiaceae bacterium]